LGVDERSEKKGWKRSPKEKLQTGELGEPAIPMGSDIGMVLNFEGSAGVKLDRALR